jgi:hypothetical protein
VSSVRYGLGFYIPEDDILHSQRREASNLASKFNAMHCSEGPDREDRPHT